MPSVKFAGMLPAQVQNYTVYAGALSPAARSGLAHLLPGLGTGNESPEEGSTAQARLFEGLLEVVDLRVGAPPVGLRGEALDALDQHPAVPRAVEDGEVPAPREMAPEAPITGSSEPQLKMRWVNAAAMPQIKKKKRNSTGPKRRATIGPKANSHRLLTARWV